MLLYQAALLPEYVYENLSKKDTTKVLELFPCAISQLSEEIANLQIQSNETSQRKLVKI